MNNTNLSSYFTFIFPVLSITLLLTAGFEEKEICSSGFEKEQGTELKISPGFEKLTTSGVHNQLLPGLPASEKQRAGISTIFTEGYSGFFLSNDSDTLEWNRPRFAEYEEERYQLVEQGLAAQGISNDQVLDAMRNVPRHRFVSPGQQEQAYQNNPLPIGYGQTISQPYIVAYMNAMLNLSPGDKVLEIGTGSGYHAATLSELTPHIYSIEIIRELGEQAAELFDELGYETIHTNIGDGYYGWEEHAPFDAIIVTAASGHIPPPLVEQLKPGGVIVIPVGSPYQTQTLVRVMKDEDGNIRTERDLPVRFVPMTGAAEGDP